MNIKNALIIAGLFISQNTLGQFSEKYQQLVRVADSLYNAGDYKNSGVKYSEAIQSNGDKGTVDDRYNAACSYALANETDSAFVQLFRIAGKGNFTDYNHLVNDPDLKSLYSDKRWAELTNRVKQNKEKEEINFDKPLVAILDTIYQDDQKYRQQIDEIEKQHGYDSKELHQLWKIISEKDSINLVKVKKILDERGWLGPDKIGKEGNETLFLVIQHSDIDVQLKYLPMMREAVKNGNARSSSLALLEDRVALRQGKKQIYGSQIARDEKTGKYFVSPLEDPDNVNKRRADVGLGTLQDYVSFWNITWNAEQYKKDLLEREKQKKE